MYTISHSLEPEIFMLLGIQLDKQFLQNVGFLLSLSNVPFVPFLDSPIISSSINK